MRKTITSNRASQEVYIDVENEKGSCKRLLDRGEMSLSPSSRSKGDMSVVGQGGGDGPRGPQSLVGLHEAPDLSFSSASFEVSTKPPKSWLVPWVLARQVYSG